MPWSSLQAARQPQSPNMPPNPVTTIICSVLVCYMPLAPVLARALWPCVLPNLHGGTLPEACEVYIRTPGHRLATRVALELSCWRLHHCKHALYPRRTGATMLLARLLALAAAAAARRIPTGGFVAAAPRAPSPRLRSRVALRRPRTTKAVALAALPTIALYESSAQLINDAGCTAGAAAGAVAWIKIWTQLAERGVIDAKLARKIVHCGSGPLYLLVWRFYSDASLARVVAALVPALNIAKLQKASQDDNELSHMDYTHMDGILIQW